MSGVGRIELLVELAEAVEEVREGSDSGTLCRTFPLCLCLFVTILAIYSFRDLPAVLKPFSGRQHVRARHRWLPYFVIPTPCSAARCTTKLSIRPRNRWMRLASPCCASIFVERG